MLRSSATQSNYESFQGSGSSSSFKVLHALSSGRSDRPSRGEMAKLQAQPQPPEYLYGLQGAGWHVAWLCSSRRNTATDASTRQGPGTNVATGLCGASVLLLKKLAIRQGPRMAGAKERQGPRKAGPHGRGALQQPRRDTALHLRLALRSHRPATVPC